MCFLASASTLADSACLSSHDVETLHSRALSFSSYRFTYAQKAQGMMQRGQASCSCDAAEIQGKFCAASFCQGFVGWCSKHGVPKYYRSCEAKASS